MDRGGPHRLPSGAHVQDPRGIYHQSAKVGKDLGPARRSRPHTTPTPAGQVNQMIWDMTAIQRTYQRRRHGE